ncbi:unnamed protein product [Rotaria sp. Silwood1]|nr:unnamed protein product [Rotaria sp. Silwood1]
MACPYALSVERENETSTATDKLTVNGSVNNEALSEILSLTGYGPTSSAKPELKRLPSSDELVTYHNYLQLNKLLDSQLLLSSKHDDNKGTVHDEHLFIIIHQSFELWFKQIIWEIDSLRKIFTNDIIDETHMFVSINRLQRCAQIWHLLCDKISILETMTPLDFMEFRSYLSPASGFQSLQFRLIENKLGLTDKFRVVYNQVSYKNAFPIEFQQRELMNSLEQPTLLALIERWLERTPGLTDSNFNFRERYKRSVAQYINFLQTNAESEPNPTAHDAAIEDVKKTADTFRSLIDEKFHQQLVARGERHNHVILVQRQIGNKQGTGGSAGYSYLRSTCSDRYKIFIDLFNLASFLVPREFIPKLTNEMRLRLSIASVDGISDDEKEYQPSETNSKE